jgi:hypothetical protein
MNGLVFQQRYDHSWYGPCGRTRTEARRLAAVNCSAARVEAIPQRSGAVVYSDGSDDPSGLTIWIPGHLNPGGHWCDVDAWIDDPEGR